MKKFLLKLKSYFKEAKANNIYSLDGCVPFKNAIPFGLQHVLAMFIGNITPIILILGSIKNLDNTVIQSVIQNAIFISGVATIIQLFPIWKVGSKLPVIGGMSFTFIGVLISIGSVYGYGVMVSSIIVGGLFIGIFGLFARYWRKLISPIVSSCVVFVLGLSLVSVGIKSFCGGEELITAVNPTYGFASWQNLLVASITLISGIILNLYLKGNFKNLSILFSLIIGYITALFFDGMIVFPDLSDVHIFSFPKLFNFGEIEFNLNAIIIAVVIYLVSTTETIGNISAICNSTLNREATDQEVAGAISAMGFTSAISGVFGSMPITTYAQNVGIVNQTKVVNRFTLSTGALILIIIGFLPPLAVIIQTIPQAVFGGCTLLLFASIVVTGVQMIASCGLDSRNILIVSLALGLGYGISLVPEVVNFMFKDTNSLGALILNNSVAMVFVIAFILDLILPKKFNVEE